MLDLRIYRAAFVAVLLAALVVAFSLQPRPRPIGTTLAPDAFDGAAAFATLTAYADAYPDRRPGSSGDQGLAAQVARDLGVLGRGAVRSFHAPGQTIDGTQDLTTVVASRPGRPGPGLVVVAHRDAIAGPAQAELSGTAALVELARVAAAGRLRRTITFVSTSGGSGGMAGAAEAVRRLPQPVDAVLVLGDLAANRVRKPWVTSWSNGGGSAPLRLSRTVESAVRATTGQDPGGRRAGSQWARLAFPMTVGEQGAFGEAGLPAVLLSASGERPPPAGAATSQARMASFGRAALRAVFALDNGPDVVAGPSDVLVTQRKILPRWAITLLVGAALLPFWLAVGDGAARARRKRLPVAAGVRRTLISALAFVLVLGFACVLGLVGFLPARPEAPAPAGAVPVDGRATAVLVALGLIMALAWIGLRPILLRRGGGAKEPLGTGHAAGTLLVLAGLTLVVWLANPFAAALLVLPAHAWLLAVAPEIRSPRPVRAALGLVALLPLLAVVASLAGQLGYSPVEGVWNWVLMVAGGHVGVIAWLTWSLSAGVAACVGELVVRVVREEPGTGRAAPVAAVRGPRTYAGPGSLGGTDSALRR